MSVLLKDIVLTSWGGQSSECLTANRIRLSELHHETQEDRVVISRLSMCSPVKIRREDAGVFANTLQFTNTRVVSSTGLN